MSEIAEKSVAQNETSEFLKTTKTDVLNVDYRLIKVEEGFNQREENNFGDIEGLALNITQNGIIEALLGFRKNGEFILTEGHRRLRAVKLAHEYHAAGKPGFEDISKIHQVPFRPSAHTMLERLMIMGITGQGKQPLTDLEKANLYERVISELENVKGLKRGEAIKQLQQSFGVKVASVYNTLSLNKLPEEIKTLIHNNEISANAVLAITREIKTPEEQIKAVEEAVFEAQLQAEKTGKAPKKATAAHVKTIKPKSVKDKLAAVKEALEKSGANNVRAKAFLELMEGLDENVSVKKLVAIFE
jgi:ParB-like chromosome segregation protein Spo0J